MQRHATPLSTCILNIALAVIIMYLSYCKRSHFGTSPHFVCDTLMSQMLYVRENLADNIDWLLNNEVPQLNMFRYVHFTVITRDTLILNISILCLLDELTCFVLHSEVMRTLRENFHSGVQEMEQKKRENVKWGFVFIMSVESHRNLSFNILQELKNCCHLAVVLPDAWDHEEWSSTESPVLMDSCKTWLTRPPMFVAHHLQELEPLLMATHVRRKRSLCTAQHK